MLKTQIKDNQLFASLANLTNWIKNPKLIKENEFQDLKASLKDEGQLMPMLVNTGEHWGETGTVLGGNMTLRGLLANNEKEGWIKFVAPTDEKHALKLALKHNAQYGYYDVDLLGEFAVQFKGDEELMKLQVSIAHPVTMESLRNTFGPEGVDPASLGGAPSQDKNPGLNATDYGNASIKQIVTFWTLAEYAIMLPRLDKIIKNNALDDNYSAAFKFLLDFYENN